MELDFRKIVVYFAKMDDIGTEARRRRIGVLPISGFALMSYASTVEPFRAANLLSRHPLYEVIHYGPNAEPIQSSGVAQVAPEAGLHEAADLDYLFVIAGGDPVSFQDRRIFNWLGRMARSGTRLGGVSGGPVILARAGLMERRRMTVHWEHAGALAEHLPQLLIERSLYVIDRDRVTCAGGTAPMDLMHALISQHHGARFAQLVSDWFLHTEVRPSIGPQRGGLVERVGATNTAILDAVKMMENHVADPVPLRSLAVSSGVSPRQLNRLFVQKLGRSTMRYYRELRLDKSLSLLRNSPLSVTEIALATGFSNSSHFSKSISNSFGYPPSTLR